VAKSSEERISPSFGIGVAIAAAGLSGIQRIQRIHAI
jgi:hypothetical protein